MKEFKLFCLPHAGGTAEIYNRWKKYLHPSIELYPLELAGRGKRFNETFYNSFDDALNDIYKCVENELDYTKYAVFGHSMGCILAYELIRKISDNRKQIPIHAFFSGSYPPHITKNSKKVHLLNNDEIIDEVLKYEGVTKELLEKREFLNFFLPIIRADYKVLESYTFIPEIFKVDCRITVLHGKNDVDITLEESLQWNSYTNSKCEIYEFNGNHFFINDNIADVVKIINNALIYSR